MGGATSKLEENDWEEANGQLSRFSTSNATIDGASPTSEYGVYYVTKRGLNQREFDVTDSQHNLLYTTRAVPKTIACFDVLGRELNQYLLRVNVDLARRYWIVCRYNIPSFSGQLPDNTATTKVAMEFAERLEPCSTPLLFRTCCIVVSWSRYDAIAAKFGPPTVKMLLESTSEDEDDKNLASDENADSLFLEGTKIASRMKARNESHDECEALESLEDLSQGEGLTFSEAEESSTDPEVSRTEKEPHCISSSLSTPEAFDDNEIPSSEPAAHSSVTQSNSVVNQDDTLVTENLLQQWLSTQSKAIIDQSRLMKQKSAHYLNQKVGAMQGVQTKTDPLEGAIQLDGPLLLCQEIYNRIVGNHQTSIVTKTKVLELLKQDKQYWVDHSKEMQQQEMDDSEFDMLHVSELAESQTPGNDSEVIEDIPQNGVNVSDSHSGDVLKESQPLVGYWAWENTLRSQKMKLHLAKDADLALHVVLAIISNQVRYERNAIAMTV